MTIKKKIKTTVWFVLKPRYWIQYFQLLKRKIFDIRDNESEKDKAISWAKKNAVDYDNSWEKIGLKGETNKFDKQILIEANKLASNYKGLMGGPGHIDFIYNAVKLLKAKYVIETGVAYGWSSLAILKGLSDNAGGKLFSIDMPYPQKNNENYVGVVVPQYLRKNWTLIRKPDNPGIFDALKIAKTPIDLCHYDSDKSWWGRKFAFPVLWKSLRSGGLFISDDIQDNLFFYEFIRNKSSNFAIVEFEGKFIGLIRKQ